MAQKLSALRGAWVAKEVTFDTDPDASGAAYKFLNAEFDLPVWSYEMVETNLQSESMSRSSPIASRQKGEFTMRVPLRGANDASSPRPGELDEVLEAIFRGKAAPADTTTSGVPTTTSVPVTLATNFRRGMWVVINVAGVGYLRLVEKIVGSTLTVYPALPSAPAAGQNVYAPTIFYPASTPEVSLAMAFRFNRDTYLTFTGCKVNSAKVVGLSSAGRPMLEVAMSAASWSQSAKASLPASVDRFPTSRTPIIKGAPFVYGPYDSATDDYAMATKLIAGLEVDFGVEGVWVDTTEGVQGKSGIEHPSVAPKATVEGYYDSDYLTQVGTETEVLAGVGVSVSGVAAHLASWGVTLVRARLADVAPADRSGILGQQVSLQAVEAGADDPIVLSVF